MATVVELIAEFRAVDLATADRSHRQVEIVAALDERVANEDVALLFARVLRDEHEIDLARSEVCKILRAYRVEAAAQSRHLVPALVHVLGLDHDILVRQWAAIGAVAFANDPAMFLQLQACRLNLEEDEDVRHNCPASLEAGGSNPRLIRLLQQLVENDSLTHAAKRRLEEWGEPRHDS